MKGKIGKILITVLIIALSFTFVACENEALWGYLTGNFPDVEFNGEDPSGSSGTSGQPSGSLSGSFPYYAEINQGTAPTQEGGLADVVDEIAPTVVEIITVYYYTYMWDGEQYTSSIGGSGVFIKKDDAGVYVITNQHVVENGSSRNGYRYTGMDIIVKTVSGVEYATTKVYEDIKNDIALLMISVDELGDRYDDISVATVQDEYTIAEGDKVVVIGNPLGTLGGTVTSGIISAVEREIYVDETNKMMLIQSDAAVNDGNSGGGMFNYSGKLLGIIVGKISATGVEGLGFAIPIDNVLKILHEQGYLTDVVC